MTLALRGALAHRVRDRYRTDVRMTFPLDDAPAPIFVATFAVPRAHGVPIAERDFGAHPGGPKQRAAA